MSRFGLRLRVQKSLQFKSKFSVPEMRLSGTDKYS